MQAKITTMYTFRKMARNCVIALVAGILLGNHIAHQSMSTFDQAITGMETMAPVNRKMAKVNAIGTIARKIRNNDYPSRAKVVSEWGQLAIENMERTGFPASVTIAQFIVEAGINEETPNGQGLLERTNNPFGIKYSGQEKPSYIENWHSLVSGYYEDSKGVKWLIFHNLAASFEYHSQVVTIGYML